MKTAPLWSFADVRPSNVDKKSKPDERAVRLVNYTDVYYHQVITTDLELMMATASDEHIKRFGVLPDDIIITKDSETPDDIGIPAQIGSADDDMVCAYHLTLLRPWRDRALPRYIYWVLESSSTKDYWLTSSFGVTRYSIGSGVVSRLPVVDVDLGTQRAIADYLDRETGEIDAMIAKLDELAETLERRRIQAIAAAIRSPRRVSIGMMVDVTLGKMLQTSPKSPTDQLQPYLRAAHVQPGGRLDFDVPHKEMWFSAKESSAIDLRSGDAVIVEGGAGFGRAAFLESDLTGWGFQNSIIRLRGSSPDTRYLVYALHAALGAGEIAVACNAATFAHFTAEKVESFRVPFHVPAERARIADHLDEVTGKIDAMLAKVAELKSLLIERRAALITDVVTGRKAVA